MGNGLPSSFENTELISVLYVSSATASYSDGQLIDFLRSWRDHNTENRITGFLLYEQGNFIQVLEGPDAAVHELVESIQGDARHSGMIILWQRGITEREFGTWCMGFRKLSELDAEDQKAFSTLLEDSKSDDRFRSHPGASHKMLVQFKEVCLREYKA